MNYFVKFILIQYFINFNNAIDIEIDGLIDFGSNWDRKYTVGPLRNKYDVSNVVAINKKVKRLNKQVISKKDKETSKKSVQKSKSDTSYAYSPKVKRYQERVTRFIENFKHNDLYVKPYTIKHNSDVNKFTSHVYKQNLKLFETLKSKATNKKMRKLIDTLARNYEKRFLEFANETQHQSIRTKLGTKKVILNTLDTSNHIVKRLVNYLIGKMESKGMIQDDLGAPNVIRNEVDKEMQMEYKHACYLFGTVCITEEYDFIHFLIDFITIILKTDDKKLKQAFDALTEVLKNTDFSNVMDTEIAKKNHKIIQYWEQSDVFVARAILVILKNLISFRNNPFSIAEDMGKIIDKTVAFFTAFEILQDHFPPNEVNKLEWTDLKNSLGEWSTGKRDDIVDIMQTFVDHIKKPLDDLNAQDSHDFKEDLNILLG